MADRHASAGLSSRLCTRLVKSCGAVEAGFVMSVPEYGTVIVTTHGLRTTATPRTGNDIAGTASSVARRSPGTRPVACSTAGRVSPHPHNPAIFNAGREARTPTRCYPQRILRTRPTATRDHACLFVVADAGSLGDHVRAGRRRIASVRGHVQGHGVAPPPPPRLGARRAAVRLTAAPGRRETSPTSQSPVPRRRVAG